MSSISEEDRFVGRNDRYQRRDAIAVGRSIAQEDPEMNDRPVMEIRSQTLPELLFKLH